MHNRDTKPQATKFAAILPVVQIKLIRPGFIMTKIHLTLHFDKISRIIISPKIHSFRIRIPVMWNVITCTYTCNFGCATLSSRRTIELGKQRITLFPILSYCHGENIVRGKKLFTKIPMEYQVSCTISNQK